MATPSAYDHQDDPVSYIRFLDGARKKERVLRAQEAGVISTDEGATWLEHLAQAGKAGLFFMSTTHFIVGGRKP